MRILLIGAGGQLGGDLLARNPGYDIVAPARADLDITQTEALAAAVRDVRADWVINTAAFHNVPACEQQPELAFRVNCVAVRDLARACLAADARLMTFSTDYVFDGTRRTPYCEDDCSAPLQIYGISKRAGECAALAVAPEHAVVVRSCGLYGRSGAASKGGNFVDARVRDGRRGQPFDMANDQTVCPTSTEDLSKAVHVMIALQRLPGGIYHLVNEGACTWFEFTAEILRVLRLATEVRPVDRGGRTGDMRRPLYSVLANTRARSLGITLPPWQDALKRYLAAKYPAGGLVD